MEERGKKRQDKKGEWERTQCMSRAEENIVEDKPRKENREKRPE